MPTAIPALSLTYTPHAPRAVVAARGAVDPEACRRGGATALPAGASLVLDFGEELVGVLTLDVDAATEATLELIEGEDLAEALLLKDPFPPEHWYHQPRDILPLAAGAQSACNQGRRAFRFVNVINHGPGLVRLRRAEMRLERYPVTHRGRFRCSDSLLNDAWEISRRTTALCMQAFYEDGVKRDGMLWIGDYRVEFLCAQPLFGDAALARRCLEMFAQTQQPDGSIPAVALMAGGHVYPRIRYLGNLEEPGGLHRWTLANYGADFVAAVWEYALHTGDTGLAQSLAPAWRGVLEFLGRVDVANTEASRTFITDNQPDQADWWGSRAALAYQLAGAFAAGRRLAELTGDTAFAAVCETWRVARIAEARTRYGDPACGECRDDLAATSTRSWHAHAAAFHAGAITAAELRAIFPVLQRDPAVRRPMAGFMEFYLLEAWFSARLGREALDEMRAYYGQMLRSGATTTWELVDRRASGIDGHVGRSHCHGWSAGPAYHLPTHALGVTPMAPGYREVQIRPQLGDLAWAEGEVATPQGNIRVRVEDGAVDYEVPAGVTVKR